MFAVYLLYATVMTYVPFLGAEQLQFPCRISLDGFLAKDEQTGSYWLQLSNKRECSGAD